MTTNDYVLKIKKLIEKYNTIIIHRHIIPDGDAYGSQLGLKELILANYPDKKVFAVGEDIEYLQFIGLMDKNIDNYWYNGALVIVTDCANVERIDDQRYSNGDHLLKIDHHPNTTPFGDTSWVDTTFTSASEMVGLLSQELNWKVTPIAGRNIYHGILTDSLRFSIQATSANTLKTAAWLLESSNFDLSKLHASMYKRKASDLMINADLVKNVTIINGVAKLVITEELLRKYEISFQENGKFANYLKDIEDVDIWLTFVAREDGRWRVEFRSAGPAVNDIAIKYGGGGHHHAAGAIIDDLKIADDIMNDAEKQIRGEFKNAD